MKIQCLMIIFAVSLASACTFNMGSTAPTNTTTNAASTTTANNPSNSATVPKTTKTDNVKKTSSTSSSGNDIRVQFAKGETSTSLTKEIPAGGSVNFLINVKKGQTIEYTVGYDFDEKDIGVFLLEPGNQDDFSQISEAKAPQTFSVQKDGDHRLTVNNTSSEKATITLYLDIN